MSKHKYTNIVLLVIVFVMLALTVAFIYSPNWGVSVVRMQPEYAGKLFSTDKVHSIDIQVKSADWEDLLDNAQAEEYIQATVVIDGEKVSGIGLRPKGNSSLAMIASSDSDRFSLKIEFDHFSNSITYHGLDKLALNNIAQDNTYMKDYITYQMMKEMGVDAPLSSFIWVTVNGADWGLYLAVEGIEESFAGRVYGKDIVKIYKPDSMDMNDIGNFQRYDDGEGWPASFGGENGEMPDFSNMPDMGNVPDFANMPDFTQDAGNMDFTGNMPGGFGGFGSNDATLLVYTDDDPESYSAIFDSAVFKISRADKTRLIQSLKQLNDSIDIEKVVDVDEVLRYFVVHNFVLNSDSYTGSLTHNYYLAENNGQLRMIAWDYNLAFGGMGGFGMGGDMGGMFTNPNVEQTTVQAETIDDATTYVNYPIDSPLLSGTIEERPMISWIFQSETYLEKYHDVYAEYIEYFGGGKFVQMYDSAIALISPYIKRDPTAFCSYDEFMNGSATLREFCLLRAESISRQLDDLIGSTSEDQNATNHSHFVDASGIDMGSMGSDSMGFGGERGQ